jgi:hypothetical protein
MDVVGDGRRNDPQTVGDMSRWLINAGVVAFAATAVMAVLLWRNAPRDDDGHARIHQQTENGWTEHYSPWIPLSSFQAEPGAYIDWVISTTDAPAKAPFTIVLRRGPPSRDSFAEEFKQPVSLIVDGRLLALKARREFVERDQRAWATLECDGSRSDLEALAAANAASIEFGGTPYGLSERGIAYARELLRRSAAANR